MPGEVESAGRGSLGLELRSQDASVLIHACTYVCVFSSTLHIIGEPRHLHTCKWAKMLVSYVEASTNQTLDINSRHLDLLWGFNQQSSCLFPGFKDEGLFGFRCAPFLSHALDSPPF